VSDFLPVAVGRYAIPALVVPQYRGFPARLPPSFWRRRRCGDYH